jgi:putative ABC transport system permease protein
VTPRREQEFDAEIESHLQHDIQMHLDRGLGPDEARRAALRSFGSRVRVKEAAREAGRLFWIEMVARDVAFGLRGLFHRPGYAVAAVLSLALGIGANTLIFSLLNATILKPLPLPDPDRLVVLWNVADPGRPDQLGMSSISRYTSFRDQAQSFENVGAYNGLACGQRGFGLEENGAPAEQIQGQTLTASMFTTLGVQPFMGRLFTESEDLPDAVAPVTLVSYGMWQRRLGGDPHVIGRTIILNRAATMVIGVLPRDFDLFGESVEFFAPLCLTRAQVQSRVGANTVVARLKPGVSIRQAQAEADAIAARLAESDPERHKGLGVRVEPLQRANARLSGGNGTGQATTDYGSQLLTLQGAVALVLLIACANVAGLLLARSSGRRGEIALRLALGANRLRVVRQLLAENVPLAVAGGIGGVACSWIGLTLFKATAPANFPRLGQLALDIRVLAFTAAVVIVTMALFAVVPAIQSSNVSLTTPMRSSGRDASGQSGRPRLRAALVTGQVALAVVLLVGAGLLINSFARVITRNLGANPRNLVIFDFRMPLADNAKQVGRYRGNSLWDVSPAPARTFDRVVDRLRSVPGVSSIAAINLSPFGSQTISMPFAIDGRSPLSSGRSSAPPSTSFLAVTPGFFQTMGIPVLQGRDFDAHDTADRPYVAVINRTMAQQFFAGEEAIGRRLTLDFVPDERSREIVGVVADTLSGPLQTSQDPVIYVPHVQQTSQFVSALVYTRVGMTFAVRTAGEPLRTMPAIKQAVAEIDRLTPVSNVRTISDTVNAQIDDLRLSMLLLASFGVIAAVLAATGLYGVMSYYVAERTGEIGIRMALGARASDVLVMIGRQAGAMTGLGLLLGLAGAVVLSRLIQSRLFGITATDPSTYAAVAAMLLLIAAMASFVPGRRATTIDPATALKRE